ncbi:MAG: hypothetical protein HY606_00855, partial [Planctomycetes bacterium]|nr:hypothetical protein [Planctomycetota bacterium]
LKNRSNAFVKDIDEIVDSLKKASWVKQVIIEGGLNPDLDLSYHLKLVKEIKTKFPKVSVQAYTPTEIAFLARRTRCTAKETLKQFKNAGIDSLNGDSAEVLNDKLRKKIRQDKLKVNDWIEVIKHAHKLSISTPISLVVGHIETGIHISEHLDLVKNVQNETGFITNLVISPFIPSNTVLAKERKLPNEINFERLLYVTAIARLSLGEIVRHITIDWSKLKFDQVVKLSKAGANDLGIIENDINEVTPFRNAQPKLNLKKIEGEFKAAGKVLMQRNPYTVKKPKYVYLNDTFIIDTDLINR